MSTKKSIIPEFMKDNPDDIFQFLFRLKIVLDGVIYKFIVFGNHLKKDFL
ncbi:tryptophan synthase subunit alpha [Aliarcobacter butzleri JV22]|nr:tryptophan synthase subunit alpha [Aliarcobacter butzleri JV22]